MLVEYEGSIPKRCLYCGGLMIENTKHKCITSGYTSSINKEGGQPMTEQWYEMARCLDCKQIVREKAFASEFLMPVCPKCGAKNNVESVTARPVSKTVWYNPLTWFSPWEWEIQTN